MRSFITLVRWLWCIGMVLYVRAASAGSLDPTHISLPSGPASVEGLGKNFTPSLASGTASYSVEIAAPPGSAGFQPQISLEYDSGGGVSELGIGWRLGGIPSLRRRTENGLPHFDPSDSFELTGFGAASRLLEIAPSVFRPEFESGAFVRVARESENVWSARDKAGVIYRFGGKGKLEAEGERVATYLLAETSDLHGHTIRYDWDTADGHALLLGVVYNDFSSTAKNELIFEYEASPSQYLRYDSGIAEQYKRRLVRVRVLHGGALVRSYDLEYAGGVHAQLAKVLLTGSDGTTALPTLELGYTEGALAPGELVSMQAAPGVSPADPNCELSDLDGDGLPDLLLSQAGHYRSYQNHDGKSWLAPQDWSEANSPSAELGSLGVQLADVDGDGASDLVIKSGQDAFRYLPAQGTTSFGDARPITPVPSFSFEDRNLRLADMDGDRRVDAAITTPAGLAIAYNVDGQSWREAELVGPIDAQEPLLFENAETQLCDVNGDRVLDVCQLRSQSLVYWLGRGRGVFEAAQSAENVPSWSDAEKWELHDLNGDGWPDLVSVGVRSLSFALALAQGVFDDVQSLDGMPERGPSTTVRFADMNGSGSTDIVWVDVSGAASGSWRYLELFPEGRAGLLRSIDNDLGKHVSIEYAPAVEDAAAARDAGTPWATRPNVAMLVVRRISVSTGSADPTRVTELHYRDGAFSAIERTFAGFGGGTESQLGDAHAGTLVTDSSFDLGLEDRTLRGQPTSVETRDANGTVFERTTLKYESRTLQQVSDGNSVHFSFKSSEQHQYIEGQPKASRTTLNEYDVDQYGDLIKEDRWGEVQGGDTSVGHDETLIRRSFASDERSWIIGRIATEEVTSADGTRVALDRYYYDGEPFVGLDLGQVGIGDTTRHEQWVGPDADTFELVNGTAYDADGNVIETRDGRGGRRTLSWDADNHTSVTAETIDTGSRSLTVQAQLDAAYGQVLEFVNFNGATTRVAYDALGRVSSIIKPGDSPELPTLHFDYQLQAPLSRVVTSSRVRSGGPDLEYSVAYIDGAGRTRGACKPVDAGGWVLSGAVRFDARGNRRFAARARRVTTDALQLQDVTPAEDAAGDTFEYDALGRVLQSQTALGIVTRSSYGPLTDSRWDGAQADSSSAYEHTPTVTQRDGQGRTATLQRTLASAVITLEYEYDALGRLTGRSDAEGNLSSYAYDGRGRLLSVDDPDAGQHSFGYDVAGNLVEHVFPDGTKRVDTFDLAGRPLSEDWDADGTPEVERSYDDGDENDLGQLVSVVDPSGSLELTHDQRERLVGSTLSIAGKRYATSLEFDAQDRATGHVYPDGSSIAIHYDSRGLVAGYGDDVARFDYDENEREVGRSFAGGAVQTSRYDADLRRTEQTVKAPGGALIQGLKWTLDGVGNVQSVDALRAELTPRSDRSERYAYDNFYRLVHSEGSWGTTDYAYSASGNLLAQHSSEASQELGELGYGAAAGPHALSSRGAQRLKYDERHRLTSDGERKYGWNSANQLLSVTHKSGASEQNLFDAAGQRRQRIETDAHGHASSTQFIDDWSEVVDGQLVRYVVHGQQRIVRLAPENGSGAASGFGPERAPLRWQYFDPWQLLVPVLLLGLLAYHYRRQLLRPTRLVWLGLLAAGLLGGCSEHHDAKPAATRGAPVSTLTDADELLFGDAIGSLTDITSASGSVRSSSANYPYGLPRYGDAHETRKYAGTPNDEAVGIDVMGVRAYAPSLGSFLSPDPILLEPERLAGLLHVDPYGYAAQNPITHVDRTGRFSGVVAAAAEPVIELAPALAPLAPEVVPVFPIVLVIAVVVAVAVGTFALGYYVRSRMSADKAPPQPKITPKAPPAAEPEPEPAPAAATDGAAAPPKKPGCTPRVASKTLRNRYEKAKGTKWPKDQNGNNQDVSHKQPLCEGGTNDVDNIEPLPHDEHVRQHKENGDFSRWGTQGAAAKKARTE